MRFFNGANLCIKIIVTVVWWQEINTIDIYRRDDNNEMIFVKDSPQGHDVIIRKYYDRRKHWKTSNLGSILYKNIDVNEFKPKNRTFKVLQWRYWGYHLFHSVYHLQNFKNPLHGCSVQNCVFSGGVNSSGFDAVVVNIRNIELLIPPTRLPSNAKQIWIWMSEESPVNTGAFTRIYHVANYYNWSMSYRTDSDVPMPYGRTVPLPHPYTDDVTNIELLSSLVPHWKTKKMDVFAAVLISNCDEDRMAFLKKLQKHLNVDVYGKCGHDTAMKDNCEDPVLYRFKADCKPLNHYLFYIVLENGRCRQYITEKVFHNALAKGAIPIIRGAPLTDLTNLLPPNSFMNVDSYDNLEELARYVKRIIRNPQTLLFYHRWRNHFKVVNEHGYFERIPMERSVPFCRICEALNYNDYENKVYNEDDMRLFLEPRILYCARAFLHFHDKVHGQEQLS